MKKKMLRLGLIAGILGLSWLPAEASPLILCSDKAGQACGSEEDPGDPWCWVPWTPESPWGYAHACECHGTWTCPI